MCLLLIAYRQHPRYPLLVLANRDEFYQRPTAVAQPWEDRALVAGRDLEAGGTWLGIANGGRVAAVTNMREPGMAPPPLPLSRGEIPVDFLTGSKPPDTFAASLNGERYRGFNALLFAAGDTPQLVCAGNRHQPFAVPPGFHGISNGAPDAPWPKVKRGCEALATLVETLIKTPEAPLARDNFVAPALALLTNDDRYPLPQLPDTGVGPQLEQALSSIFVRIGTNDLLPDETPMAKGYGTRASTLVAVDHRGATQLWEQSFEQGRPAGLPRYFQCPA